MMKMATGRDHTGFRVVLIVVMPLILIVFLGSQMALQQVVRKSAAYTAMPEVTQVAVLRTLPPGTAVLLKGRISRAACCGDANDLVVYQERPADGRDVRFREAFNPHFPEIELALPDGPVRILPRLESEHVIQHAHHIVTLGGRQQSGFRLGDVVTVQGQWQADQTALSTLKEVTGITGMDKAGLLSEWQLAIRNVTWVSRLAGLLSALGMVMFMWRVRQWRAHHRAEESKTCMNQTTKSVPATSLS